ncbi:hypothetical protein HYG87_00630 [Methanobacterium alkalithermotolerans]|uniref:Uncharacterized protein n=1 Tax=Methanobacterium alkalithermotolerans TaxID=2731220 RepID=A0A8T8K1Y3_9EURY|nr:hypothetical protein [Methanobacterium alkalithermotolerans]QUH22374.1 hypothetical protein HYG87_00630 [Methanobacterium alkalithermotolerans]
MESVIRETRAVKYKTGEYDFRDKVNLIECLSELKPKQGQILELKLLKNK